MNPLLLGCSRTTSQPHPCNSQIRLLEKTVTLPTDGLDNEMFIALYFSNWHNHPTETLFHYTIG